MISKLLRRSEDLFRHIYNSEQMTPEHEIERIKANYKEHWPRLQNHPGILWAIKNNNPIKLGEIAAMVVYGNYWDTVLKTGWHYIGEIDAQSDTNPKKDSTIYYTWVCNGTEIITKNANPPSKCCKLLSMTTDKIPH
jgi:hypothetical protein